MFYIRIGKRRFFFCVFEILYIFLELYVHVFASVTAGSVNPAAIYVVRTIYNPTNNVVLIKYRTQNPHTIYTSIFALHVSYISSTHSPSWRRYTFLRVRLLRTACTYLYINHHFHIHKNILLLQLYMYLYASVTAGTVCPVAIYHVRTIYNPTNNVVHIQYVSKYPQHKI